MEEISKGLGILGWGGVEQEMDGVVGWLVSFMIDDILLNCFLF